MSLDALRRRIRLAGLATVGVFAVLGARLAWLQTGPDEALAATALDNALREQRVVAPRGRILDRDDEVLADARPTVDLTVRPADVTDPELLRAALAGVLEPHGLERLDEALASEGYARHRPWVIQRDVDQATLAWVAARRHRLPGADLLAGQVRTYPEGRSAAHLVGYLSEVGPADLLRLDNASYRPGDQVGRRGLERDLEPWLHGRAGRTARAVDALGRPVHGTGPWHEALEDARRTTERPALPGADVRLTLDADVQRATVAALGERPGAAVMLDVHTGGIVAYASSPAYDPGELVRGVERGTWRRLVDGEERRLMDRVVRGVYPPASTFKMVTAAAALEAGIDPGFTVDCKGSHRVGRRRFRCWKRGGHGVVDLVGALRESCDVWFYEVGLELGPEPLAALARRMGLGPATGFGLNDERGGLLPSRAFVRERFGYEWSVGDTASASIGQGIDLATPLQLAVMTATVANGGQRITPWVVEEVRAADGATVQVGGPRPPGPSGLSPEVLAPIREGLRQVVMHEDGTARKARIEGLPFAGKTGTAQVVSAAVKRENPGRETEDHALFVAYAPLEDPRVAVAVVVEHAGGGSTHAAPVAQEMLRAWAVDEGLIPEPPTEELAEGAPAAGAPREQLAGASAPEAP